jgi:hypothetical protein
MTFLFELHFGHAIFYYFLFHKSFFDKGVKIAYYPQSFLH